MKLSLVVFASVLVCLIGCGKKAPEPTAQSTAAPVSASVETAAPTPPPPPVFAAETPAGDAAPEAEPPGLAEVNLALNAYTMGQLKEPTTLEDLVKTGYIKRVPTPPPGKKFILNPSRTAVLVVDK